MSATVPLARVVPLERSTPDLPRYRLVSRLATGGMAEVFLALMPDASGAPKPVVIKRLWPELARDAEQLSLFQDEVRLSLRLHHPNVIHAYESGADDGHPYLAMEYLDGQSFKHVLDRARPEGTLSLPLSLKIVCDVLAGLEYIHGLTDLSGRPLGVVHCDVSPQNVFVTCDGAVKLIDFGIARSAMSTTARRSRDLQGRVAYMAPEQVVGESVDHRADLFSVGVMLWEAAVGSRLWQGLSSGEIMQRLLSNQPIPRLPRERGFPPGLAAVCARALALDPNQRYASACEFQSELAALSTGSMPAQTRVLGGLVSRMFASSRALSRNMIQQSLPSAGGRRSGTAAMPIPQAASGPSLVRPRRQGTTRERTSTTRIVALHDDITQVGPAPTQRRNRHLPLIAAGLFLGAFTTGVAWWHQWPTARPSIVPADVPAIPMVLAPEVPTLQSTATEDSTRASQDAPPLPAEDRPPPARNRRHGAQIRKALPGSRKASTTEVMNPPLPSMEQNTNDWANWPAPALRRGPSPAPRPIDREDPYRP